MAAVSTLAGGRVHTVEDMTETVGGLKRAIQAKRDTPRSQQRPLLGEHQLDDDVTL